MPFLCLNAEVVLLRLLGPLLPESDEELLRLARRFIQLENGRRFECLSVIGLGLAGGYTKGQRPEVDSVDIPKLVTYHVIVLVLQQSPC